MFLGALALITGRCSRGRRCAAAVASVHESMLPVVDQLTGLATRQQGTSALKGNLELGAGAAVVCDIDDLGGFNQSFGYGIADQALQAVAKILASTLTGRAGPDDEQGVFRLGGDEFLICLPGRDATSALALAEQARSEIRSVTSELVAGSSPNRPLTARFAVAGWENGGAPGFHRLMLELDDALYSAGPDVVVLVEVNGG